MAEQNSYDFWTRYSNLCLKCKVCPLKSVIKHMRGTTLSCLVERIRSEHWQFLLSALSVDNSLTEVCFKSELPSLEEQKELWKKRKRKKDENYPCPYGYSPQNISDICKYSARLLNLSQTLQSFIIENLPLTKEDALHLEEGLKSTHLKEFALRCYPYSDEVIEIVCRGLWNSKVFVLDFSSCNLSFPGLDFILNVIMKHKDRRSVEAFPDTLRCRLPNFEEMMGLSRIILNGNKIGDKGIEMICNSISDDHWIQALDLQCCGITKEGAKVLLKQITANNSMQVIDLRLNVIDGRIIERISMQLGVNSFGKMFNHASLPLWKPRFFPKPVRKNMLKTKVSKKYSVAKKTPRNETRSLEHAFRISCEILHCGEVSTQDAVVQTDVADGLQNLKERNKRLELAILKEVSRRDSLVNLSEKFKFENGKLRCINEKLRQENNNLRQEVLSYTSANNSIIIDKETYFEVKLIFEKFQRFLKLMKDNGLWELVSTIGVAEYQNTRLKTAANDSRARLVEEPPDEEILTNDVSQVPFFPKLQRCCSCRNPECISNQKAEKEDVMNANPDHKVTEEKCESKSNVDKAKMIKLFKEVQEGYSNNCDTEKQAPPAPKSNCKHSLEDLKIVPLSKPLSLKYVFNKDAPQKLKSRQDLVRSRQDLDETVKNEMANREEGVCQLHKAAPSSHRSNHSAKSCDTCFKPFSPRACAFGSVSNTKCHHHKTNQSGAALSDKSGKQPPNTLEQSLHLALQLNTELFGAGKTDKHVIKKVTDSNIKCAGAEAILVSPEYFKVISDAQERFFREIGFSKGNEPTQSQSTTNENANLLSDSAGCLSNEQIIKPLQSTPKSSTNESHSCEQVIKPTSQSTSRENSNFVKNQTKSDSSNLDNSSKSYLETVSDASTDKDVQSLMGSELYESVKNLSINSKNGDKAESGGIPGVTNSLSSVSSSKSSKRSQKQKKKSNQNASGGGKVPKGSVSSSSVPSLSDITTVSSHSLNTNSVMNQLSESGKNVCQ